MFHKRASKSAALLFFNMVIVLVSALLVLVNIRARSELEESRRGFYSQNAVELSSGGSWEEALEILLGDDWKDGILFKDGLEMEADTRGVFYKGDFKKLPLASGRYFTEEEVSGTEKKAMIGQRFERDTYEEGGKQYLEILGEPFEVVGVLGSAQPTRLDSMKWIPLAVAVELTGPEGIYKLDGKSERAIEKNAESTPAGAAGAAGCAVGNQRGQRRVHRRIPGAEQPCGGKDLPVRGLFLYLSMFWQGDTGPGGGRRKSRWRRCWGFPGGRSCSPCWAGISGLPCQPWLRREPWWGALSWAGR